MSGNSKSDLYVAPLKKAKGLGSAHTGTHHWMMQKITALLSLPLIIWLIWSITSLHGASYAEFTAWLSQPLNAILMIILVCSVMLHAQLGSQVIVEDYIANEKLKMVKLICHKILFFGLGVAMIFSILKITFVVEPIKSPNIHSVEQRWSKIKKELPSKYMENGKCVCNMPKEDGNDPLQKWRYIQCVNTCKAVNEGIKNDQ